MIELSSLITPLNGILLIPAIAVFVLALVPGEDPLAGVDAVGADISDLGSGPDGGQGLALDEGPGLGGRPPAEVAGDHDAPGLAPARDLLHREVVRDDALAIGFIVRAPDLDDALRGATSLCLRD